MILPCSPVSSPAWVHQQLLLHILAGPQAESPQEAADYKQQQWQEDPQQKPLSPIQSQCWYLWLFQPGFLGVFYLGLFVSGFALFNV